MCGLKIGKSGWSNNYFVVLRVNVEAIVGNTKLKFKIPVKLD